MDCYTDTNNKKGGSVKVRRELHSVVTLLANETKHP